MAQKILKGTELENADAKLKEFNKDLSEFGEALKSKIKEANQKDNKFNGKIHSPCDKIDFKAFFGYCKKYDFIREI